RERAEVRVRRRHDGPSRRHQLEHRRDRGDPRRERRADPALQGADGGLEHLPRRVAVAAVPDVAARVVRRGHHERRVERPVRHPWWPAWGGGDRGRAPRGARRGGPAETAIVAGASDGSCEGDMPTSKQVAEGALGTVGRTMTDATPGQPRRKPRVAVVFGCRTAEHAVSCVSAGSVLAAIDRERYDVVPVGISHEGRWVLAADEPEWLAITRDKPPEVESTGAAVVLAGDPTHKGLTVHEPGQVPE